MILVAGWGFLALLFLWLTRTFLVIPGLGNINLLIFYLYIVILSSIWGSVIKRKIVKRELRRLTDIGVHLVWQFPFILITMFGYFEIAGWDYTMESFSVMAMIVMLIWTVNLGLEYIVENFGRFKAWIQGSDSAE
ncbi:hypothetical protein PL11_004360 [Lentilactobacillus curieae]|uniref:Uncharacterized protein n=1 Tax=Lentilactobacillus curieae TaxID=1138822 RepID=A0A1S6QHX8_9LACO|nr:hypothetical protein PL11_004360 [Lentilactobacillus curieae]